MLVNTGLLAKTEIFHDVYPQNNNPFSTRIVAVGKIRLFCTSPENIHFSCLASILSYAIGTPARESVKKHLDGLIDL